MNKSTFELTQNNRKCQTFMETAQLSPDCPVPAAFCCPAVVLCALLPVSENDHEKDI